MALVVVSKEDKESENHGSGSGNEYMSLYNNPPFGELLLSHFT